MILLLTLLCAELTVFVHIPKTAGETFKRNIEASYQPNQCVRTSFNHFEPYYDIREKRMNHYEGFEHFQKIVNELTEAERKEIKFVGGHDSYYGIHQLFSRKPNYIAFLRDPIDRTISLYNFERMVWDLYSKKETPNRLEQTFLKRLNEHFIMNGSVPSFEEWLDHAYDQTCPFYFSMTRYLEHLGFAKGSLDQFSFIGLTENHEEDVLFLYHEWGVNRFYSDKNASKPFIRRSQLDKRLLDKIEEKNRDDFDLYQRAIEKNKKFRDKTNHFDSAVSWMKKKKKIFYIWEKTMNILNRFRNKYKKLTEERYVPGSPDLTTGYEHIHRYSLASQFADGKTVLDLASGEGYGTAMLAEKATHITGIEICPETVAHAQSKYKNVDFRVGSIEAIPIEGKHLFDLAVCFEAIEHIAGQEALLTEVKRLLRPDGLFIVSTPNKPVYSEKGTRQNPHHVKELEFNEFDELLGRYFAHRLYYGQKSYAASKIFPLHQAGGLAQDLLIGAPVEKEPRYFIAVASNDPFEQVPEASFLTDVAIREGYIKWEYPEKRSRIRKMLGTIKRTIFS